VAAWGVNFDRLMKNKQGQKYFAEFLKSEYSDENILFWQACEELKREKNTEKIEEKARIIYEDFISILSPKEVSLDSRVREIINQNMVHPSSHTFDEAQNQVREIRNIFLYHLLNNSQIYTLMQRDSYPRFIASPLYKKLLRLALILFVIEIEKTKNLQINHFSIASLPFAVPTGIWRICELFCWFDSTFG
jgi:regulator of G-protein signaling